MDAIPTLTTRQRRVLLAVLALILFMAGCVAVAVPLGSRGDANAAAEDDSPVSDVDAADEATTDDAGAHHDDG